MNKVVRVALAFLPFQAGLNARLGKAGSSAVHASMISFVVGAVGSIRYILINKQTVSWAGNRAAPAQVWLCGPLGAFYVTGIILVFPQPGPGLTFGLVVAGQMVVSLLLEHYNILVA